MHWDSFQLLEDEALATRAARGRFGPCGGRFGPGGGGVGLGARQSGAEWKPSRAE